jgi:hypothetical protein
LQRPDRAVGLVAGAIAAWAPVATHEVSQHMKYSRQDMKYSRQAAE